MFAELREAIACAALAGVELDTIDAQFIRPIPVDEEQKSALWLYAQAVTDRPMRSFAFDPSSRLLAPRGLS